jgi:hypothetical protein
MGLCINWTVHAPETASLESVTDRLRTWREACLDLPFDEVTDMPDAAPVVRVLRARDRLLDEGEDRRRHRNVNTGEVLGRDLGEVAGGGVGVGKDTVGDGLGAGVDADDGEAVERVAGLVDTLKAPSGHGHARRIRASGERRSRFSLRVL